MIPPVDDGAAPTADELIVLGQIIDAAENECALYGAKRWGYFAAGGWGGDRLRDLRSKLARSLRSPSTETPDGDNG